MTLVWAGALWLVLFNPAVRDPVYNNAITVCKKLGLFVSGSAIVLDLRWAEGCGPKH